MTSSQKVPIEITGLGTDAASVHAGARGTCALMKNGTARCWGSTEWGSIGNGEKGIIESVLEPTPVLDLASATAVAAPSNFTCALVSSGAVKCWGDSSALGLAEGPSYRTYKPAGSVVGLTDVVEIGTGTEYACARKSDGSVLCWGENGGGQLGDGKGAEVDTSAWSDTPVGVASLP